MAAGDESLRWPTQTIATSSAHLSSSARRPIRWRPPGAQGSDYSFVCYVSSMFEKRVLLYCDRVLLCALLAKATTAGLREELTLYLSTIAASMRSPTLPGFSTENQRTPRLTGIPST